MSHNLTKADINASNKFFSKFLNGADYLCCIFEKEDSRRRLVDVVGLNLYTFKNSLMHTNEVVLKTLVNKKICLKYDNYNDSDAYINILSTYLLNYYNIIVNKIEILKGIYVNNNVTVSIGDFVIYISKVVKLSHNHKCGDYVDIVNRRGSNFLNPQEYCGVYKGSQSWNLDGYMRCPLCLGLQLGVYSKDIIELNKLYNPR